MRDIKFRARDSQGNWQIGCYYRGVVYPSSYCLDHVNDTLIDVETLGQFTGLKDENGVEIYEGDIIKFKIGHESWLAVVFECVFVDGAFGVVAAGDDWFLSFVKYTDDCMTRGVIETRDQISLAIEVIGNRYQNPELLTSKETVS